MATRALTPWLTREWLSHRNLHGPILIPEPTLETKRLQLVTATGISNDPGDTLLWCEMTDGECWIDCCIPTSLVDAFDSTTSLKFTASSASKCLFRAHSWRFVLASPLVPARSSPSKRHLSTNHQQRKSLRVCLRIERFDRHSTGDGHFAESFAFRDAAARDEGGGAGGNGARGEADKQRAMWVRKVEQGALDERGAGTRAAPEVAYAADLPPDPARRTRPAPVPAPVRNPPLFPAASTSSSVAPPLDVAPAVPYKRPRPSWPAGDTPVRLDWAAAASLLDRRASSSSTAKSAAASAARRASEAHAAPPAPVQPSVEQPEAPAPAPAPAPAGAVGLDWTAASSLLTSSSARKRVKLSPSPGPAPAPSTSTSTSAAASRPSAPAPASATAPTAAVALDWSAAASLLSSSARKRARPSLGTGSTSSASASSSSAAVLESNRALLDQEVRARARAQAQTQAQRSSPSAKQPQPQLSTADAAKNAAAQKRQQERVRLLATQLADVGGGGGAAARAAVLESARKAHAGGSASPRGAATAGGSEGKAAGRPGKTERPGERGDREADLRARDVRRASSGSRARVDRSGEGAARAATAAGATTAARASSSRAPPARTSSPPPAAPPPPPRQLSPALSIRSQASEPVDALDEDVVMRDESSPARPPRSSASSAAPFPFQPLPTIEQRPSLPPSTSSAAPLGAPPRPPAPSPPRHAHEPDPPLALAPVPRSTSPTPAPAGADCQPQPQQPARRRVANTPTSTSAAQAAQAAADEALAAQAVQRDDGVRAPHAQLTAHQEERRRGQQVEGASGRVVEAQQKRSASSAGSPAPVKAPRRPRHVVAARALIPLEVWDFGAWLRSRGYEGFDVPHEVEDDRERAEVL
ncbi:hypothetical protein JCM9279_000767 [Rhodotorula babjevae]